MPVKKKKSAARTKKKSVSKKKRPVSRTKKKKSRAQLHRQAMTHATIHVLGLFGIALAIWGISFFWFEVHAPEEVTVVRTVKVVATAYNSVPGQTDDTPCITANGFNVCEHNKEDVIATNGLRFGTRVRFPALGTRIFTVQDRMNARYGADRVDLWFKSIDDARHFGARLLDMEILAD